MKRDTSRHRRFQLMVYGLRREIMAGIRSLGWVAVGSVPRMSGYREPLREPVNVPDALARDRIVSRFAKIRANAVQTKRDIEHWNTTNPDQEPIATVFEDKIIDWCDGKGPEPSMADVENDS